MTVKPIRNYDDLAIAKKQVIKLIEANDANRNSDEIEVLSTLIEQFERMYSQLDAPNPIAAIKFRMEEMGLSQRQLEPFIGSRARVSEVLSGKRTLSIDMIRSLHDGLRIPYESLISERSSTRRIDADEVRAKSVQDDIFASLHSTPPETLHALLRKTRTQRAAAKTDQRSLAQWQDVLLAKGASASLPSRFQRSFLNASVLRQVAKLSAKSQGPLKAIHFLAARGVCVIVLPPLAGTFLDGAAMIGPDRTPIVGITLRYDRVDSFWFTLLHELAHIHLHFDELIKGTTAFVDDMEIQSAEKHELEADELAQVSLIPNSIFTQVHWSNSSTADDLIAIASRARVHISIVAGRWQRDHGNYRRFARLIERDSIRPLLLR